MDHRKLILLFTLVFGGAAYAGYASVARPPGLSNTAAGGYQYKAAANDAFIAKNTVLTNSALNVAGTMVTVPVAMTYAANAATIAATFSFGNPAIFGLLAVGSIAYDYYKSKNLSVENGAWVETTKNCDTATCTQYGVYVNEWGSDWFDSFAAAEAVLFERFSKKYNGGRRLRYTGNPDFYDIEILYPGNVWRYWGNEPRGFATRNVPQASKVVPIAQPDFETKFPPGPMPEGLPQILPISLPVNDPYLNPVGVPRPLRSPQPSTDAPPLPDAVPGSKPLYSPVGDPVLEPNSNPQVWDQPYVKVVPSPTPDDKFRVDIQPKTVVKPDSSPMSDPQIDPTAPKVPDPANPSDPATDPKDKERTPGLCELYPDILACQKLDVPDAQNIENKDVNVSINPDSGWGPANGSCPAPRVLALHGLTTEFSWQPMCDFASGIRGVILAVAWVIAAGSVIGMARRE